MHIKNTLGMKQGMMLCFEVVHVNITCISKQQIKSLIHPTVYDASHYGAQLMSPTIIYF